MRVKDIMTQPATTCGPETSVAIAGHLMEDNNCGILPVVDNRRRLVGVITDRDLLLAAANTNRNATHVSVHEAMKSDVMTCSPEDDLRVALDAMRAKAVRRLPVTDRERHVLGVLSIDDIVRWGVQAEGLEAGEVIEAFEEIFAQRGAGQELEASEL
jgi:CBS domain-containing protein